MTIRERAVRVWYALCGDMIQIGRGGLHVTKLHLITLELKVTVEKSKIKIP